MDWFPLMPCSLITTHPILAARCIWTLQDSPCPMPTHTDSSALYSLSDGPTSFVRPIRAPTHTGSVRTPRIYPIPCWGSPNDGAKLLRTEPQPLSLVGFERARKRRQGGLVWTATTQCHWHPSHFRLLPYMNPTVFGRNPFVHFRKTLEQWLVIMVSQPCAVFNSIQEQSLLFHLIVSARFLYELTMYNVILNDDFWHKKHNCHLKLVCKNQLQNLISGK